MSAASGGNRAMLPNAIVDLDARQKHWTTLAARACLRGWQVWRSDAADGPQRFFLSRWGQVRVCADLAELERFVERGGAL